MPDGTDTVSYSLDDDAGGRFTIDADTGVVTVAGGIDHETATSHNITVRATSTDTSSTTQTFTIGVGDVNDNPPVIVAAQNFSIAEDAANGDNVGTALATDVDTVGSFQNWAITGGNTDAIFAIDATTGQLTIADNTNIDFETTASYALTLTVSDGQNTSAPQMLTVNITDVNETPVAVDDVISTNEDTPLVISEAGLLANDSDADSDPLAVTSSTQPTSGTLVNNGDGTLTYTPVANFEGADSFTYTISDGNGGG